MASDQAPDDSDKQSPTEETPPEETPPERKRSNRLLAFLGAHFLAVSIIVHVIGGIVATIWIVQTIQAKRKVTFAATPPSLQAKTFEKKVAMAKKQSMSAPAQARRIASTSLAKINLPEMPKLPSTGEYKPGMSGMGGLGGGGLGGGGTGGGGGGGGISIFGFRSPGGGSLKGTFYDLKQTREGRPNEMVSVGEFLSPQESKPNEIYVRAVASFIGSGLDEGMLSKYFAAPRPLYNTQIYMPSMDAAAAPQAFDVADKASPKRWIVCYKGRVTPPMSGRFRFVGTADDVLAVRFDNRLVLSNRGGMKASYAYDGVTAPANVGPFFEVTRGSTYDMQIAVGEQPGGNFYAFLLIEKDGENYEKDGHGNPRLPIFKLSKNDTPAGPGIPAPAGDTAWSVWKAPIQAPTLPGMGR